MRKRTGSAIVFAVVTGAIGLGAVPAYAATCYSGNVCSYDNSGYGGTTWRGGHGDFVEVPDDVTNSTKNNTSRAYYAKNNTAWAQEETIAYISAGTNVYTYSGDNNRIDHYRAA